MAGQSDGPDGGRWEQLRSQPALVVVVSVVAVLNAIMAVVSYANESVLAQDNGQSPWKAHLIPFAVDGILVAASVALLWARWQKIAGWQRLWRLWLWLAVGIAATIMANLAVDLHDWWLRPAVSAACGVAVVLVSDIGFWMLGQHHKIATGEDPQRVVNCSCPAPPTSLAEAIPLAREALEAAGQPHGEEVLAERFGISRHRLRQLTVEPVAEPSLNGNGGHA